MGGVRTFFSECMYASPCSASLRVMFTEKRARECRRAAGLRRKGGEREGGRRAHLAIDAICGSGSVRLRIRSTSATERPGQYSSTICACV